MTIRLTKKLTQSFRPPHDADNGWYTSLTTEFVWIGMEICRLRNDVSDNHVAIVDDRLFSDKWMLIPIFFSLLWAAGSRRLSATRLSFPTWYRRLRPTFADPIREAHADAETVDTPTRLQDYQRHFDDVKSAHERALLAPEKPTANQSFRQSILRFILVVISSNWHPYARTTSLYLLVSNAPHRFR